MTKILLSADSTCDLSPELKERYNVHYYPFHIIFRGQDYLDNVTITPDVLHAAYRQDGSLPQTAAINEAEYLEYFTPFVEQGYQVIHFNLGAAISSAHEHCKAAAAKLPGVWAIDSQNLSTGIALQIIRAGNLINEGMAAEDIVADVKAMRSRVHSSFILDTLDFMAAGGRCPGVLAAASSLLKIKPEIIVHNNDGSMSMGKLYRGKLERVFEKYVREELGKYPDIIPDHIFLTSSGVAPEVHDHLRKVVRECVPNVQEIHSTEASCCISSHCGPGTLGILFATES